MAARELEAVIGSLGVLVRDHLVAIRSLKTATDQLIGSLRDLNFTSTLKDVYRDLNATIRALEDPTRKLNSYTRKLKAVDSATLLTDIVLSYLHIAGRTRTLRRFDYHIKFNNLVACSVFIFLNTSGWSSSEIKH